ncbi:DUF4013 domain-containing protein [Halocatena salina]|uniref:DUF4013 domain-containing protein n=1 Tax=Halocatena salina TaxID=2934340 RepID=A0A8U0A2E9_9EURY|nr:DUF4013 domain-containing protein [Halocatena salina]UPM42608.1 DUF4013 domain-containing protein [Halocatena salina]
MLGDALGFPTARSGWQKTVGVGGILLAVVQFGVRGVVRFSSWGRSLAFDSVSIAVVLTTVVVVLSGVVLVGYHVRVFRSAITVDPVLPSFRPVRGLLCTGLELCLVVFVYWAGFGTVLVGLGWAVIGGGSHSTIGDPTGATGALSPAERITGLTIALIAVVLAYASIVATARFAHVGHARSAIAVRSVLSVMFTSEFFVGFVLWSGILLVLGGVGVVLVSIAAGLFVVFYATVAATYALGRGYQAAIDPVTK